MIKNGIRTEYTDTTRCKACGMYKKKPTNRGRGYNDYKYCSKDCEKAFTNYPEELGQWWNNHHNYPQKPMYKYRNMV